MAIRTFAAIDLGSYEVSMKIFEMSKKYGLREINHVRYRLDLGKYAYSQGKIENRTIQELCRVIDGFREIMKEYQVEEYRACATSAFRAVENPNIILEQVYRRTGIQIEILSGSEQHFLGYKSIAAIEAGFKKIIQKGTAIVDVGGGNTQVSLFDKDTLVTTQNLRIGSLRIRERLRELEKETTHYDRLVEEFIRNELLVFQRLYLKERNIQNVILLGDFLQDIIFREELADRIITKEEFNRRYEQIVHKTADSLAMEMNIPSEYATLVVPMVVIYKNIIDILGAEALWAPGISLADGIAYDYGEKHKIIKSKHNFENDILVSARNIAKRYMSSKNHTQAVAQNALAIFDGMKKLHGMGKRERLLLQIAILLHDCGNYISLSNASECAYEIIMSTEIIGLSHKERKMIAHMVKFIKMPFQYYGSADSRSEIDRKGYMTVAKLTAIIRVANVLDRSHRQKIEEIRAAVKEQELVLTVSAKEDLTLERGLLPEQADFFEEIFSIRPVLKVRMRK